VSSICQTALERAVRDVESARAQEQAPTEDSPGVGLFTRFTPRARQAMARAEQAARDFPHNYVGTEHVLLGVIDEGGNLALKVLEALEIEAADLRIELVASMGTPTEVLTGHVPFTPQLHRLRAPPPRSARGRRGARRSCAPADGPRVAHDATGGRHRTVGVRTCEVDAGRATRA
jgi:hypothetical protein